MRSRSATPRGSSRRLIEEVLETGGGGGIGSTRGDGLAIHGADAARSESAVVDWIDQNI